ncbi:preprotein translocase, SecE subunit [Elusimicrobium minutum Pei191]|uniref:Protein translocase subunit SecE n=1 Tax=Elusimicrobium minutum (strain Pei191) TaxID=445932 RepID=B2KEU5_ELUMP|nr:preprotein translocase subunit SecE [Elusimicrobium minutum]ACC99041.1 preprotein translocase, SecE subunit [Elusimicrobium minutum Pei191]
MNKIIKFSHEAYAELKKSKWLSRQEVVQSTILVGIVVFLAAIYVFAIDWGLAKAIGALVNRGA